MYNSNIYIKTPYKNNQATHPDVKYFSKKLFGYHYWMVNTPYPYGNDRYENPIIRFSQDGIEWNILEKCKDPLVDPPLDTNWHNADTDLAVYKNTMYLVYMTKNRNEAYTQFMMINSNNAVDWSEPRVIYEDFSIVSPSIIEPKNENLDWLIWYVYRDSPNNAQESSTFLLKGKELGVFDKKIRCDINIPNYIVWHIDVIQTDDYFESLIAAFPFGKDPSRCSLFHAMSKDGIKWTISNNFKPIIKPNWKKWCNKVIYRSTFIKENNYYKVWFSGASWGGRWQISLMEGYDISDLEEKKYKLNINNKTNFLVVIKENLIGLLKHIIILTFPEKVTKKLMLLRRKFIKNK